MKNNWYYLFSLEEKGIVDENVAIVLDELFRKFIFKGYDEYGDIVVLYVKDKEEYRVKQYNKDDLFIILRVKNGEESLEYKLKIKLNEKNKNLRLTLQSKEISKCEDTSYVRLSKSKLICESNESLKEQDLVVQRAKVSTSNFYINSQIETKFMIPDSSHTTKIKKANKDVRLENELYVQRFKIQDTPRNFSSNFPICFLLIEEHLNFLKDYNYEDDDLKNSAKKSYKIGF